MFEGLFQPMHLLIIAGIALLVFGPKKLPEIARTLGKGMAELRRASNELKRSLEEEISNLDHIPEPRNDSRAGSVPTYGDHPSEPAPTESEPRS